MVSAASPVPVRFCTAGDGVRIAFASAGGGPPLVKAPNWMNHLQYDWESPIWRPWALEMARRYRYTSYDARGCGLSDRLVADHSFETHLRDLEAVVDAARLERFALLGMCQGAAIAIAYAARHPERVSHLILYGAYAQGKLRRPLMPQQRDEADLMVKLIEIGWGKEDSAFRQVFTTQFIPDCTLEQVREFDELQRVTTSAETAAVLLRMFHDIDVSADAGNVRCPALVMHSNGDRRVPFEEGRSTAALIPGAHFVLLESRNHILLDHQVAWRQFFAELDAFTRGEAMAATVEERHFLELTQRERDVLELIARGLDNGQIAAGLGMSPKTVRNHINAIFAKLSVPSRAQAIVRAREAGFGRKASVPPA
jgi:pimeloyl-ACP methyl ester carboxylesterase/DNA-binding CsgD family transcriptional regulator